MSLAIDQFGWFGMEQHSIGWGRSIGAGLMVRVSAMLDRNALTPCHSPGCLITDFIATRRLSSMIICDLAIGRDCAVTQQDAAVMEHPIQSALWLLKRQQELQVQLKKRGERRLMAELELQAICVRLSHYPEAVKSICEAAQALRRSVDSLSARDVLGS